MTIIVNTKVNVVVARGKKKKKKRECRMKVNEESEMCLLVESEQAER